MFSQACVKNSVHKGGGHVWWGACMAGGACMVGGMHGREHAWWGHVWQGVCGGSMHVWYAWGACMAGDVYGRGACVAEGMCGRGVHGGEGVCKAGDHAWQERQPLQWTLCILLECILASYLFT